MNRKMAIILMAITMTTAGTAFGIENGKTEKYKKSQMMEMTKEQRESMATKHEKMSTCLRSDKSMSMCRDEMMEMTTEQRKSMADGHEKLATCLRSNKSASECHEDMMDMWDHPMMGMKYYDGMMRGKVKSNKK